VILDYIISGAFDLRERLVREYVIAGRDPRDPAASRNGVKSRAMFAAIAPAVLALGVTAVLPGPEWLTVSVPLCVLAVTVPLVTGPINDACDEWEQREEQIRQNAKNPHPHAGGGER
jgi:hypothetical protein